MVRFRNTLSALLLNKKYWFVHFWAVSLISIAGLLYLGTITYTGAPPLADFKNANGDTVVSRESIVRGQSLFHARGLMHYGSFWGDGAERGPDFTAESLHIVGKSMREQYADKMPAASDYERDAIEARVRREIRNNGWDAARSAIMLSDAQARAFEDVYQHYVSMFTDPNYPEAFRPSNYITDTSDIRDLASFFFWGAWVSAAERPGETYSYTHNWPFDPQAGNLPTLDTYIWSFISIFALFIGIMLVLYLYGQMKASGADPFKETLRSDALLTTPDLEQQVVRHTQRRTYKFFVMAMIAFALQVTVGVLAAMDFAGPFAPEIGSVLPFTALRSYHTLLQIFWFFMCWVGYTLFFLPRLSAPPKHQALLIDILFYLCAFVGIGGSIGIYAGLSGMLTGAAAYWFGSQGWEFMELGRFFQYLLLAAFSLWIAIIYRGIKPWITKRTFWSIPAWLLWGSGIMVFFLFFGLLATPESNFAVADFWRWMVVHMWVEVTFEVFTTVIVAFMLHQMGFVSRPMAERVIYLAVILFLATATVGVAHNFYWIAKPTGVIAFGSVFSTLQVLPLLLLTLDAWKMRKDGDIGRQRHLNGGQNHLMDGVWLFILAVNFWNIFGAGVFGSLINLPIINYFEHATYLTGNHAHAAMFGVKGNVALAGMLFCIQHLIKPSDWNRRLVMVAFWALNIGIVLMMFMALFPAGIYQLMEVLGHGFWYARSQAVVAGDTFRMFVYLRSIGAAVFVVGVAMISWFVVARYRMLRQETHSKESEWDMLRNDDK